MENAFQEPKQIVLKSRRGPLYRAPDFNAICGLVGMSLLELDDRGLVGWLMAFVRVAVAVGLVV